MSTVPNSDPVSLSTVTSVFGGGGSIRAAASAAGLSAPDGLSEFKGLSSAAFPASGSAWFQYTSGLGGDAPEHQWGSGSIANPSFAQAGCNLGFQQDKTNDRIAMRWTTYTSAAASSYSYAYVSYTGHDSTTFQAKCVYTTTSSGFTGSVENPASYSPASNTFANVSDSTYSPIWQWSITVNSGSGTRTIQSNPDPVWTVRAGSGASDDSISGPSGGNSISLSATRGSFGPPGGGGDFCIHEDMKISTQLGDLTIDELLEKSTKVWGWNKEHHQSELTDVLEIKIVEHDTLYKINNIMLTDDHILYTQYYRPLSVNPTKAKTNYDKDSTEIKVGDKLMKKDGTLETVTSIEAYSGTHRTYTVKTTLGNFYADEILVDSEI